MPVLVRHHLDTAAQLLCQDSNHLHPQAFRFSYIEVGGNTWALVTNAQFAAVSLDPVDYAYLPRAVLCGVRN